MTGPAPSAQRHVIIVDGDVACLGASVAALGEAGFRVTCAANALAAMRHVLATRPDVIVLEHALPDFTGLELARAIRSVAGCAHLPLIFLSGEGPGRAPVDTAWSGFESLSKPVEAAALVDAVWRAIGRPLPDEDGYSISRRLG